MVNNESEFRVKVAVRVCKIDNNSLVIIFLKRFDHFYHEKKLMNKKVVLLFIHKQIKLFLEIEKLLNMILFLDQKLNK